MNKMNKMNKIIKPEISFKLNKNKCPHCGKETLEPLWYGINPQECPNCGHGTKSITVSY